MGWVGVGGGTNNIGGAFELSLAGPNNTDSILRGCYHRAGMTAVPFSYPWQNIAQHSLSKTVTKYLLNICMSLVTTKCQHGHYYPLETIFVHDDTLLSTQTINISGILFCPC